MKDLKDVERSAIISKETCNSMTSNSSGYLQIEQLVARRIRIPLTTPFRISVGEITEKEFVILEAQCGPWRGWGEAAVDGIPVIFYGKMNTFSANFKHVPSGSWLCL